MKKQSIVFAIIAILVLSLFRTLPTQAQGQGGGWSEPYRLSSTAGASSEAYLAADQYGYIHCFWTETLFDNADTVIKYARFDGTTWTKPNDIYLTGTSIKNVSPVVDQYGILHVAWSEGPVGTAYYTYAPANNALSVQNWANPVRINVPARPAFLKVDSKGVLHIMYINETAESGVYYIHSEDGGVTWSEPLWLDPDIRPGYIPDSLNFVLDENDGMHAAWFYATRELNGAPDWIRYTHSLDGGRTWITPLTIDQAIPADEYFLTNASPVMMVQGETVHIIWAAGDLPYRRHSFSTDGGLSWSTPVQIFGELHGQAFDGMTVDASGRVHFFGQIRYPQGIWHAVWDQGRWSIPSLVYLVAELGETIGTRVHAHNVRPVVRAGNQLVVTFADGPADPNRRLFVTYRTLDDVSPLEIAPTPMATATAIVEPTPGEPTPTLQSATPASTPSEDQSSASPDLAIRVALVPTLLLLGVAMFYQLFYKRKR